VFPAQDLGFGDDLLVTCHGGPWQVKPPRQPPSHPVHGVELIQTGPLVVKVRTRIAHNLRFCVLRCIEAPHSRKVAQLSSPASVLGVCDAFRVKIFGLTGLMAKSSIPVCARKFCKAQSAVELEGLRAEG